jgi:hypothetical protein
MGLGLLILVSVGKENLYLSAQPEITFFKIAYRRHTNFSIEPVPQYFKTTPDFGRRCTVNISKNSDLMGTTYLYVELPSIQLEQFTNYKKFAWVNKIGLALINFIEFEIGGNIIDRHYGDWLNIWHDLTISMGLSKSYNRMIGNVDFLKNYSQTKESVILYIPLSFWFCNDTGLALPLIALQHNDVKIHVEFNNFDSCYKISPSNYITVTNNYILLQKGEYFYQTINNSTSVGEFIYFDPINNYLYYNAIKGKFIIPSTNLQQSQTTLYSYNTNFPIIIAPNSIVVNDNNYFSFNTPSILNSYLLVNYIYLDNFERLQFIKKNHEYIIPVVQTLSEQIAYSSNISYKLPLINPVKLLVWRGILTSNLTNNNQFDYSIMNYLQSNNLQNNLPENIINNNKLIINSIERMGLYSSEYYTTLPTYQYNFLKNNNGVYMYSFGLYPKNLDPSGSMNFSKIDDAYLQLSLNKNINYQNPVSLTCYAVQYNLLRIISGIGGLVFNI